MTAAILYIVVGLISCFTSLVIIRVYNWRDEVGVVAYPLAMFILWPIGVPITFAVFVVIWLGKLADVAAKRIQNRKA